MSFFRPVFFISFLLMLVIAGGGAAQALVIEKARFGQHPDKTRMVLDLSSETPYRVFTLSDPWRLVIDLPRFSWDPGTFSKPGFSGITDIRQGNIDKDKARIVMDFDSPVRLRTVFFLPESGGQSDRLVIDFTKASATEAVASKGKIFGELGEAAEEPHLASSRMVAPAPEKQREVTPAVATGGMTIPAAKPTPPKKPIIVIDAGHGGADPGALGGGGIKEKNITLAMAYALKKALEQSGRYEAKLTRADDRFIRLHERVNLARDYKGDLFVSLHADSIGKSSVRGASIYTLSEKSSDAQTAKLAMRENRADLIAGVDLSAEDEVVVNILVDLAMRDTMNQSKFFANTVVDTLSGKNIRILQNAHRYAGFAVLKAPDIPSVLIEMGFLSNDAEARLLASESFRKNFSAALVKSIDQYFAQVKRNQRS